MIDVDNDVVHAAAERTPGGMCTYMVALVRLPALRHDAENFLCLSVFGRTRARARMWVCFRWNSNRL